LVALPEHVRPFLVAPKGPGEILRARFGSGTGIPALIASEGDEGLRIAMAYAGAIGCGKGGVIVTTFGEEAVADLFGEQCVLSGGMIALMKAAFDILIENGCPREIAYIECVSEVEYMAALISKVGLANLAGNISSTAYYGGVTRGRRIVDTGLEGRLRDILKEIESGEFVQEFRDYVESGRSEIDAGAGWEELEKARASLNSIRSQDD
jgi:ketol-acid reductoisomerase